MEYDRGTLVRTTIHAYAALDTPSSYIVDRNIATSILDSSNRFLAHSQRFYDSNNQNLGTLGSNGRLTRELQIFNLPLATSVTNVQLNGRDSTYNYDSYGNPTSVTTYSGPGWVLHNGSTWSASTPGNGSSARTTTTDYDPVFHTFPTKITNPLSHVETAGYDYRMATLTSVTDANNQTTSAIYDVFGRMVKLIRPGDSLTYPTRSIFYYDTEQPFHVTFHQREISNSGSVLVTQQFYDGLGRLLQTKAEAQWSTLELFITDYRYDGLGRLSQQSIVRRVTESAATLGSYRAPDSQVAWTTTQYDALGRVLTVLAADGGRTDHYYGIVSDAQDPDYGLATHDVLDGNRHRTQERFDALGRRRTVLEYRGDCGALGWGCGGSAVTPWQLPETTRYSYSPLDLLTRVVDTQGTISDLGYDSLGRKTSHQDPDMGSWSYGYDANGNLTSQTDARGVGLSLSYDQLDRPTGMSDGGVATTYRYDEAGSTNGIGRRTSVENSTARRTFEYDARGRLQLSVSTVAGLARGFQ